MAGSTCGGERCGLSEWVLQAGPEDGVPAVLQAGPEDGVPGVLQVGPEDGVPGVL